MWKLAEIQRLLLVAMSSACSVGERMNLDGDGTTTESELQATHFGVNADHTADVREKC